MGRITGAGAGQSQNGSTSEVSSVSVRFTNLPKDSQAKLLQLLLEWGRWHAAEFPPQVLEMVSSTRVSGKVQCDPALFQDGSLPTWIDIPADVITKRLRPDFNIHYEMESSVPKYDRSCNPLEEPSPQSLRAKASGHIPVARAQMRCFNCGSYSHSLKECWQQRDSSAIDQARAGTGQAGPKGGNKRYFAEDSATPQEYVGLEAGKLSASLRLAMGLGPMDPPPWIHRMRQLGYPPGYMSQPQAAGALPEEEAAVDFLDNAHAEPITYGIRQDEGETATGAEDDEYAVQLNGQAHDYIPFLDDMDVSEDQSSQRSLGAPPPPPPLPPPAPHDLPPGLAAEPASQPAAMPKELVAFPGINAPIPEQADPHAWGLARQDLSHASSLANSSTSLKRRRLSEAGSSGPQASSWPRLLGAASDSAAVSQHSAMPIQGLHQGPHSLPHQPQQHASWPGQPVSANHAPNGQAGMHAELTPRSWNPDAFHSTFHPPPPSPFTAYTADRGPHLLPNGHAPAPPLPQHMSGSWHNSGGFGSPQGPAGSMMGQTSMR